MTQHAEGGDLAFRVYQGGRGKHGHEYVELEVNNGGWLRYENHSKYRHEGKIIKRIRIGTIIMDRLRSIIIESGVNSFSDLEKQELSDISFSEKDATGNILELEIIMDSLHLNVVSPKPDSLVKGEVKYGEALLTCHKLSQELLNFLMACINLHFKKSPF